MSVDGQKSNRSLYTRYLQITAVVAAYWIVSITMVFANKALLSGYQLRAPFFITGFQCVVTVAICACSSFLSPFVTFVSLPATTVQLSHLFTVMPLSVVFVGMITFNNLCLQNVDVSFYYIGRSLTTVFNVICSYTILGQKTSCECLVCCAVIIFGFLLGVDQEKVAGALSISGVCYGVLASLFVSLFAIYTKKVLPCVDGSVWRLSYLNNINACCLFAVLIVLGGEWQALQTFSGLRSSTFWLLMSLAGVFGFAIGYVTGLQIQVTSPLTHNISGTAKACAQTVLGCWWWREWRPLLWWISNAVVLAGSASYTCVKQRMMAREHRLTQRQLNC